MATLHKDLAYTIISKLPLIVWQRILNDNNIDLYKFILFNKYKLSLAQIDKIFMEPINQQKLTISESFVKVVTYQGELGFDQHLYVDGSIPLILAIKSKNTILITYYLDRFDGCSEIVNDFILILAIKTGDINIVNQVKNALFDTDISIMLSLVEEFKKHFPALDLTIINKEYGHQIVKYDVTNLNRKMVKYYLDTSYLSTTWLNYYGFSTITASVINMETVGDFPKINVIEHYDLITKDMISRIDTMQSLILQIPISYNRDYYLLQLDILQGKTIDLTSNLLVDEEAYLIQLMFEVLHPQLLTLIKLDIPNFRRGSGSIRESEVIYDVVNFLPISTAMDVDTNELNSGCLIPVLPIWLSIWCNNLQWLVVANTALPVGPLEQYRFSKNMGWPIDTIEMYQHLLQSKLTKNNNKNYTIKPVNDQQKQLLNKFM